MAVATQPSLVAQLQNFGQLTNGQKIGLIIAGAAIIALFSGAFLWYQTPTYQVLYTSLSEKDGGAVINALQQMNVPFKAEGTSAIKVPIDKVYEVRLKLAAQGIPKGGAGFDLLDNQKLGVSQFVEQVNFQRALEGELVRTIEAISAVQGARVHLAIPRPSVFLRDQQKPSASVLLNLGGGKRLDPAQISGIVHLVSSSVADLPAQNITVVDQNGKLLIAPDVRGNKAGLDPSQLEYLQQVEASYIARIESIIAPLVGAGNVHAQVTADLDFSQTEQTAETFKPNPTPVEAAIRSQQSSDNSGAGTAVGGVPGALSNQPPGAASAPITTPPGAAAGGAAAPTAPPPVAGSRESTINYELDKTVRRTKLPVGAVKRLSAAVAVNYKQKTEGDKVSLTPLTAAELSQINNLVKEAMGFSQQRGDSLNVVNAAFNLPPVDKIEEIAFWEKPSFAAGSWAALKFLGIALVIWYLVSKLLMPILRLLATPPPAPEFPPMEAGGGEASRPSPRASAYQDNLQAARDIARQDPKVVATVVKEWVGSE